MKKVSLTELLEAGSHFGHQKRRWNPLMSRFIYGERDGVHVFDLAKTKEGLENACEFLADLTKKGGVVLFVGTKRQASELIEDTAKKAGMPYVNVRWMGGLLTNWSHLSKSIAKFHDLKKKKASGELKKYTKKEQLLFDREIARLDKFFGGVSDMTKIPDALFAVDTHREEVAVLEAVRMGVPVVGIVDSNANPNIVDYPIPANDDALKSIELIVNTVGEAISTVEKEVKPAKNATEETEVVVNVDKEVAEVIEEKLVEEATKKPKGEK